MDSRREYFDAFAEEWDKMFTAEDLEQLSHLIESFDIKEHDKIVDLGCGTGSAGAAWALATDRKSAVHGFDLHPWAVKEAAWTYERFDLKHQTGRRDASKVPMPGRRDALLAAWSINELRENTRLGLFPRLMESATGSDPTRLALAHVAFGETDEALRLVEVAVDGGSPFRAELGDPAYDPIRAEPRFQEAMRRVGLIE